MTVEGVLGILGKGKMGDNAIIRYICEELPRRTLKEDCVGKQGGRRLPARTVRAGEKKKGKKKNAEFQLSVFSAANGLSAMSLSAEVLPGGLRVEVQLLARRDVGCTTLS